MQDRQDRPIACGIEEIYALPRAHERPGLGFAVANDRCHNEFRVVERRAEGMCEHIAEFAALVNGTGGGHAHVTWHAAGSGELAEEPLHTLVILCHIRIDLRVGAFQINIGDQGRASVSGPARYITSTSCSLIRRLRWT